jgi:hypothetical protein
VIAAAVTVEEASPTPLFVELEEILGSFASLAKPAQRAVAEVVESLIVERNLSVAERALATALLVLATVSRCGVR